MLKNVNYSETLGIMAMNKLIKDGCSVRFLIEFCLEPETYNKFYQSMVMAINTVQWLYIKYAYCKNIFQYNNFKYL